MCYRQTGIRIKALQILKPTKKCSKNAHHGDKTAEHQWFSMHRNIPVLIEFIAGGKSAYNICILNSIDAFVNRRKDVKA